MDNMKRFLIFLLILVVSVFLLVRVIKNQVRHDLLQPVYQPALTPSPTVVIDRLAQTNTSLFVPEWTVDSISNTSFDRYIYFGITSSKNGIDTAAAQKNIDTFEQALPDGKQTLLTLQMQDTDTNGAILQNKTLAQKVISQTVTLAKQNNFSGIVLDLEMGGIPFDALIDEINGFTKALNTQAKAQRLSFAITLYGDTFYRLRPFDVKTIAGNTDMVMIMAYDFHKARSNPGPNFPLSGQSTYGYDMGKMADDFLQAVPNQKLSVIFGLFGYDWPVDNQGNAVGQGQAVTDLQIQNKFLTSCKFSVCDIKRDPLSDETQIRYTDDNNQKHIVWFEDMQSVGAKEQYLKKRGIGNFSFWANSYF
jgi:spore germination protein YaaH